MNADGEKNPLVGGATLKDLLNLIASGNCDADVAEVIAWQLAECNRRLSKDERDRLTTLAGGREVGEIARGIIEALDPKRQKAVAESSRRMGRPGTSVLAVSQMMLHAALRPIRSNAQWRDAVGALTGPGRRSA